MYNHYKKLRFETNFLQPAIHQRGLCGQSTDWSGKVCVYRPRTDELVAIPFIMQETAIYVLSGGVSVLKVT